MEKKKEKIAFIVTRTFIVIVVVFHLYGDYLDVSMSKSREEFERNEFIDKQDTLIAQGIVLANKVQYFKTLSEDYSEMLKVKDHIAEWHITHNQQLAKKILNEEKGLDTLDVRVKQAYDVAMVAINKESQTK